MYELTGSFTIVSAFFMVVFQLMLFQAIRKCRRIPKQIRWLSLNYVISDAMFFFFLGGMTVILLLVDEQYFEIVYYSRVAFTPGLYSVSWSTTVGLALERLITLTKPLHFQDWFDKKNCVIFLTAMWIINFMFPACIFTIRATSVCGWDFKSCDISNVFIITRLLFSIMFTIYAVVILVSYFKIMSIVKDQLQKIQNTSVVTENTRRNQYRLTSTISTLILVYTILHLPLTVYTLIFIIKPDLQVPKVQQAFQVGSYFIGVFNTCISSYLFIWKISECRLNFLQLFCSCSGKQKERNERLRIRVFNIVHAQMSTDSGISSFNNNL